MKRIKRHGLVVPALAMVGCAVDGVDAAATVRAEVTSVPSGVQCVRLAVRAGGATTATNRDFTVTAGQATTLDLGVVVPGALTVTPSAYNVACASVTTSTAANWAGEAASATVRAGEATALTLTLRPNVRATATVDFVLPARSIAASELSAYAVMADGTVRRWGYGAAVSGAVEPMAGLTNVVQVAPRGTSGCALLGDGTVRCWGVNTNGELGNGTTSATPIAASVPAANQPCPASHSAGPSGSRATIGLTIHGHMSDANEALSFCAPLQKYVAASTNRQAFSAVSGRRANPTAASSARYWWNHGCHRVWSHRDQPAARITNTMTGHRDRGRIAASARSVRRPPNTR